MDIDPSEPGPFWSDFRRNLAQLNLRGVKVVISEAHEGIKSAVAKCCTWLIGGHA
jgi:putative transposase